MKCFSASEDATFGKGSWSTSIYCMGASSCGDKWLSSAILVFKPSRVTAQKPGCSSITSIMKTTSIGFNLSAYKQKHNANSGVTAALWHKYQKCFGAMPCINKKSFN